MPVIVYCDHCDKEISKCKSKVKKKNYCSKTCSGKGRRNKIEVTCTNCDKALNKIPALVRERNFCNRECYAEWQTGQEKGTNKVQHYCDYCGSTLEDWPSQVREINFCDRNCAGKYHSKRITGSGHPNWKGGHNTRLSPEYKAWRLDVYERDKFTCQKCGQVGGELNAHHVLGWARFESARFKLSNGVTLCKKCHHTFHNTYTRTRFTEEDYVEFIE